MFRWQSGGGKASREMDKLKKKGHPVSPVVIEGRTIVKTFWGKAWCENLERYSDFENRLPRGRTYVRNGSVIDLQIAPGEIKALVSGSEIYKVTVKVAPVAKARWKSICKDCAGAIDSLVELLQGRFSKGVMERVCRQKTGLFPSPDEIQLSCSCPDWADMCKHVAAVLYGIGARLDQQPDLLFRLARTWTKRNSSPGPERRFPRPRGRRLPGRSSAAKTFPLSLDWTWLQARPMPCRHRGAKRAESASRQDGPGSARWKGQGPRTGAAAWREDGSTAPNTTAARPRRKLSAAGRKRIAAAQKKRWAAFRKANG